MPHYFKILNALPSFSNVFTKPDGTTANNPYPNYGSFGNHLEDYFKYHMRETPAGGSENLVAYLNCDQSMTAFVDASLTQATNYLYSTFGVTQSTSGYALLDFRNSPSWDVLTGDGIVGQSNSSSTAFTAVKNAAVSILDHLSGKNPNVKWAYAGLPCLPQTVVYAPNTGATHDWLPTETNTGTTASNYWDNDHPTVGSLSKRFYPWPYAPTDLKDFHLSKCIDSVQEVLDSSDWLCPDINPVYSTRGFYRHIHSIDNKRYHTQSLMDKVVEYKDSVDSHTVEVYPLVNSLLRSRNNSANDSPYGYFEDIEYFGTKDASGNSADVLTINTTYNVGYGGLTFPCNFYIPEAVFKGGMLIPASDYMCEGFTYLDQIPFTIELAGITERGYTGTSNEDIATRAARAFINQEIYYSTYPTLNQSVSVYVSSKNEIKSYLSYNNTALHLTYFSEVLPIGSVYWPSLYSPDGETGNNLSATGSYESTRWFRGASYLEPGNEFAFSPPPDCCITPDPLVSCCVQSPNACPSCLAVPASECARLGGSSVNNCRNDCIQDSADEVTCRIGSSCQTTSRCLCRLQGGTVVPSPEACACQDCGTPLTRCFRIITSSTVCPCGPDVVCVTVEYFNPGGGDPCCNTPCLEANNCQVPTPTCSGPPAGGSCAGSNNVVLFPGIPSACNPQGCPPGSPPAGERCCDENGIGNCRCPPGGGIGLLGESEDGSGEVTTTTYNFYEFLADDNIPDSSKQMIIEKFTGLLGFTSASDLYRYVAQLTQPSVNSVGLRQFGRLVRDKNAFYEFYSSLKINNTYVSVDYNFRRNSTFTTSTANRIRAESSGDLSFVDYTYIP